MQLQLSWQIDAQPHTYALTEGESVLIGRRQPCDIILRNRTVSRQHAKILVKGGRLYLHNLSEVNPIPVYTTHMLAQKEMMPLYAGYALQFGFRKLRVQFIRNQPAQRLIMLAGKDKAYLVAAEKPAIVGRKQDCDIVLSNMTVSRQHALIFAENDAFHLLNLSQSNDIQVDTRQKLRLGQTIALQAGDSFQLGQVKMQIQPAPYNSHIVRSKEAKASPIIRLGKRLGQAIFA